MSGTGPEDPFQDPELPGLVAAALESRDAGREVDVVELCGARTDLVEAVRASIDTGKRLGTMQGAAAGLDRFAGRTLLERYRLDRRLGAGAMGVVYLGRDLELKRDVAVKILRSALIEAGEAEQRFVREAEVLASLDHPSVVRVFDRGRTQDEDEHFLVMEFVEGRTLQELLDRRRSLPFGGEGSSWLRAALGPDAVGALPDDGFLRLLVRWGLGLAGALQLAHDRGVFHRDVKPSNILVGRDGIPRLADFGIAAVGADRTITREGQPLGTPAFTAPEVLDEGSQPGPGLDVYGLSATLYAALAGRPPYQGTPSQVLARLAVKEPDRLDRLDRTLPRDLCAVVEKGMARDPRARYASAADLAADLRAFLDHRPTKARPVSDVRRWLRRARRSRAVLGAVVASALILVGTLGRLAWLDHEATVRAEAFEGLRRIPPKLGLAAPENRRATSDEEFRAVLGALDEALRSRDFLLPAGPLRAAYLHDHGRVGEAAAQARAVADALGTPYSAELARRYAALPDDSNDSFDLDLKGMPETSSDADRYLAFLHAMRVFDTAAAKGILAERGDEDETLPALREYELLFSLSRPREATPLVLEYEQQLGGRTAMTADMLGLSLTLQGDHPSSHRVYTDALVFAPHCYVLHENAATPAFHVEGLAVAVDHCRAAVEMRPDALQPRKSIVLFELLEGRCHDALDEWERMPATDVARWRSERAYLRACIHTVESVGAKARGELDASRQEAALAAERFAEAEAEGKAVRDSAYYGLALGLGREEPAQSLDALSDWAAGEPLNSARIEALTRAVAEGDRAPSLAALQRFLSALDAALERERPFELERFEAKLRAADPPD
ncbi:MAG: serine/threonine-protein kinase [Planctomycetota bacterium]